MLKISIVIPVYNEASYLDACLEAIARQNEPPFEVIIVDNNSTDDTRDVVKRFSFVKLINEPKQGVIHARKTGFDAAQGDIIGRIDADSVLPADWTAAVAKIFSEYEIDAVSGSAHYYDFCAQRLANFLDLNLRRLLKRTMKNRMYLWGANMAMTKNAWEEVSPFLCRQGFIHEDQDIAIHMQEIGQAVTFDKRLKAGVSTRRVNAGYKDFVAYIQRGVDTYSLHNSTGKQMLNLTVFAAMIGYLPALILHRGFNKSTGRFSLRSLMQKPLERRVDPTSNVA